MKESIMLDEQEEETTFTLEWYKLYAIIALFISVSIFAFFSTYTANLEANEVKTQLNKVNVSTGAKIDALINKRAENRKEYGNLQKQKESIAIKQDNLNANTAKIEEELEKLNISVIN